MPTPPHTNGDHSPPTAAALPPPPRVKQSRPHSPVPSSSGQQSQSEVRPPPPKRARKAINCEPCRNSKLKCDRNRPCSSCVLRGTTALCYQNADSETTRTDDHQHSRVDPTAEFSRIRHSLSLLESFIVQNPTLRNGSLPSSITPPNTSQQRSITQTQQQIPSSSKKSSDYGRDGSDRDSDPPKTADAPGLLGQSDHSGFYAGPTSTLSHLLACSVREDSDRHDGHLPSMDNLSSSLRSSTAISETVTPASGTSYQGYDEDLISLLPPIHTIDGLIDYYFEYCNWIYRHVNQAAFTRNWNRFKTGGGGDRVVLATVCILILLAVRYLPNGHALLASLPGTSDELEARYYGVMREASQRHKRDLRRDGMGKGYSLDLIELLLVRSHYLTFAKEDPEETWAVKGELVNIGTAMGLHKDPGDTRFTREEAERRRWAWWHIILLERWQAFMFGRPLAIASNHYNTRLPSYCDPALDKAGRLYLPNIALFKLAYVLGDIMDDAVSFRPVPYASIQNNDKKLMKWFDELPVELDLDDYRLARSLASPITSVRRLGVQSVIIRTAYHHIRFTLHRPYATVPASLGVAVSAAGQLITLVGQTRPDFLSNTALAVPGHMNWGPFHVFSAAMFFSFQLITHPDQPAATLFRENINKAIACLDQSRWMPVADKALTILQALAPLYSDDFANELPQERKRKKAQVLKLVKTLAFPYQDSPPGRGDSSASSSPSVGLPSQQFDPPSPSQMFGSIQKQTQTQLPVSSMRWTPMEPEPQNVQQHPHPHHHQQHHQQQQQQHQHHQQQQQQQRYADQSGHAGPSGLQSMPPPLGMPSGEYTSVTYSMSSPVQAVPPSGPSGMQNAEGYYMHPPADDSSMWGASVGFGLGEWAQFLDVMQRPDERMRGLIKQ